jgi:hypothetical protein
LVDQIISLNPKRQRAMAAANAEPLYAEEARKRQGQRTDLVANLPESDAGRARDKAGADFKVSGRAVQELSIPLALRDRELHASRARAGHAVFERDRHQIAAGSFRLWTASEAAIAAHRAAGLVRRNRLRLGGLAQWIEPSRIASSIHDFTTCGTVVRNRPADV